MNPIVRRSLEVTADPYDRHSWEGRGIGHFSVCSKCRAMEVTPGVGVRCPVILSGPPWRIGRVLVYPGGLAVRASD